MLKNPYPKVGEFIVPISGINVDSAFKQGYMKKGEKYQVVRLNKSGKTITVKTDTAGEWSLTEGSSDVWILPTRENTITHLQEKKKELEEEIKEVNEKIDFYTKYEDEDEYIADKIEEILNGKLTKKARIEAIKLLRKHLNA